MRVSKDVGSGGIMLKYQPFQTVNFREFRVLFLKIIAGILLGIWLILVLIGKGGFVHILLLNGIAIAVVALVCDYRGRVRA